jgi:glycosyltransferase involved in cell wall biosynthesis
VLESYGDRIQTVFKPNGGQPSAINAGFRASHGDLIANLDADDMYTPDMLERVVKVWRPDTVKAHFPLRVIDAEGADCNAMNPRARLASGNVAELLLKKGKYISSPSSGNVYSRSVLERILPIPEQSWDHFDSYLETLAPFYGNVIAFDDPLGFYRVHDKNMSGVTGLNARRLRTLIQHNEKQFQLLCEFCREKGLTLSPKAGLDHWTHQKLLLTLAKMDADGSAGRTAREFIRSAWKSRDELSLSARLRLTFWALAVLALPRPAADSVLQLAYSRRGIFSIRA